MQTGLLFLPPDILQLLNELPVPRLCTSRTPFSHFLSLVLALSSFARLISFSYLEVLVEEMSRGKEDAFTRSLASCASSMNFLCLIIELPVPHK